MHFNYTVLEQPVFKKLSSTAGQYQAEIYLIGGFVRDLILGTPSKDLDILVVGDGVEFAYNFAKSLQKPTKVNVYKNFGTASLHYRDEDFWDIEFVGARKESYAIQSRKPFVEPGTLKDDLNRRDFTINALAISLNQESFGHFIDVFHGLDDLKRGIVRTPLNPDITFSDDPLRMMRAIRFATHLDFTIEPHTFSAIRRNAQRLSIVSIERIMDEFNKILTTQMPSRGLNLLKQSGLMEKFFPEFLELIGVEYIDGKGHKDNYKHTLEVLDNISRKTDSLWLRWAALLHDIAKPATRRFDPAAGWTFHGHEILGARMVKQLFRKFKLPLNEKMEYVAALVHLHLRPIALVDEEVTDSAIRRLLFDAGDLIDDLMLLCEADITSKNPEKVRRYLRNFEYLKHRMKEVEERDRIRNFQPPISGDLIMQAFNIPPSYPVGAIKNNIKEAILDGKIHNNYDEAFILMLEEGDRLGLKPVPNILEVQEKFRKS